MSQFQLGYHPLGHAMENPLPGVGDQRSAANQALLGALATTRFHLLRGSPVVVPGVGRLRVTVSQDMELRMRFAPDRALLRDVQDREQFTGRIANAQRGGLSHAEYKELWDAEFPDDPLQLLAGPPRKTRPFVLRRGKRRKLAPTAEDAET